MDFSFKGLNYARPIYVSSMVLKLSESGIDLPQIMELYNVTAGLIAKAIQSPKVSCGREESWKPHGVCDLSRVTTWVRWFRGPALDPQAFSTQAVCAVLCSGPGNIHPNCLLAWIPGLGSWESCFPSFLSVRILHMTWWKEVINSWTVNLPPASEILEYG